MLGPRQAEDTRRPAPFSGPARLRFRPMSGSTYIVTGGAGFIGANLVAELLRRDPLAHVVVVDDFRSGSFLNIVEACDRAGVGPFSGTVQPDSVADLSWQPALVALEPRAVFHLAAITDTLEFDEKKMLADNTEPFADLLDACTETATPLVYASSAATYGSPPQGDAREPFPEPAAGRPNNVYGFSKWLMDAEVFRLFAQRDAAGEPRPHVVGLRYFNVFGPGEHHKGKMASMVWHLTGQMIAGNPPRLFEFGEHARDQVYVKDVVAQTIAAAAPGVTPGVYNAGSGRVTSFNEIAEHINRALGTALDPEYFEMPAPMVPTYQHYTCADMSAAREGLAWTPTWDPADAIAEYVAWIRDRTPTGAPAAS